jgi:hypothetical protein
VLNILRNVESLSSVKVVVIIVEWNKAVVSLIRMQFVVLEKTSRMFFENSEWWKMV